MRKNILYVGLDVHKSATVRGTHDHYVFGLGMELNALTDSIVHLLCSSIVYAKFSNKCIELFLR